MRIGLLAGQLADRRDSPLTVDTFVRRTSAATRAIVVGVNGHEGVQFARRLLSMVSTPVHHGYLSSGTATVSPFLARTGRYWHYTGIPMCNRRPRAVWRNERDQRDGHLVGPAGNCARDSRIS